MKTVACCFLLVFFLPTTAFPGAWTQKRGHGYYKLGLRIIRADQFYDANGDNASIPTLTDAGAALYTEYGLTDRLTAIANLQIFRRLTREAPDDSKSGLSDSDLGVRWHLFSKGRTVVSAEVLLGLPLGDDTHPNGLLTGDGEFNQLVRLQVGRSFYPSPFYLTAEVGFNNRTEGYSDEVHYGVEIGYTLQQKFLLIFRLRGLESLDNGSENIAGGMGGLYANNKRYLAYGPELNFLLNDVIGLSAGLEGAFFAENEPAAPAVSFGIFVRR